MKPNLPSTKTGQAIDKKYWEEKRKSHKKELIDGIKRLTEWQIEQIKEEMEKIYKKVTTKDTKKATRKYLNQLTFESKPKGSIWIDLTNTNK